jgi:hypothetical protein
MAVPPCLCIGSPEYQNKSRVYKTVIVRSETRRKTELDVKNFLFSNLKDAIFSNFIVAVKILISADSAVGCGRL